MIAIDWGTTSFRAYLLDDGGRILERREAAMGVMAISSGGFADVIDSQLPEWIDARRPRIVMSGMIGSRQGWKEVPYVRVPAGLDDIAAAMQEIGWGSRRKAWIVPGLATEDAAGVPDVMRGEETQLLGIMEQIDGGRCTVCLPGTHSKWAALDGGRILSFSTHMTGETFALLRKHSILGRTMTDGDDDDTAFDTGVERARDKGGLLHHIFGVRARTLIDNLGGNAAREYLSGVLIGHELLAAAGDDSPVHVVGTHGLARRYRRALEAMGRTVAVVDADGAATRGIFRLAQVREAGLP